MAKGPKIQVSEWMAAIDAAMAEDLPQKPKDYFTAEQFREKYPEYSNSGALSLLHRMVVQKKLVKLRCKYRSQLGRWVNGTAYGVPRKR